MAPRRAIQQRCFLFFSIPPSLRLGSRIKRGENGSAFDFPPPSVLQPSWRLPATDRNTFLHAIHKRNEKLYGVKFRVSVLQTSVSSFSVRFLYSPSFIVFSVDTFPVLLLTDRASVSRGSLLRIILVFFERVLQIVMFVFRLGVTFFFSCWCLRFSRNERMRSFNFLLIVWFLSNKVLQLSKVYRFLK